MISYNDNFVLMMWLSLSALPIILFLRGSKPGTGGNGPAAMAE